MWILTAEQMSRADESAARDHGISAESLMDNAGREIAAVLAARHPDLGRRRTLILCGKGNNGGDGVTAARHLLAAGVRARVVLLAAGSDLRGAAAGALERARAGGLEIEEVVSDASWGALRRRLPEYDLIVDGLLGTGTRGPATGRIREAIEAINASGCRVVSIDIPSGLSGSDASVPGPCVEADLTVALAALKVPHAFPPACRFAGEVVVADIGIPRAAVAAQGPDLEWADAAVVEPLLRPRDRSAHKGDFGHVLVVAGSRGKGGAAVLMARACLRSGSGLVTVAVPASAQPIVAAGVPEAMTEPMPETGDGLLAAAALPALLRLAAERDVVAAGPGLGTAPETAEAIRGLAASCPRPIVLDADALNILAQGPLPRFAAPAVLTPHPGEAARLLGVETARIQQDRPAAARLLASSTGACAVLKGYRTLVASPAGPVRVNPTGNPGMATGGSGDVLSGVVAAWLAQGLSPFDAASLAVHGHGLAGDLAAAALGEIGLVAGDIVDALPRAWRALAPAPPGDPWD